MNPTTHRARSHYWIICANKILYLFKIFLSRQLRRIESRKPSVRVHLINAQNYGETDGVIDEYWSRSYDRALTWQLTSQTYDTDNSYFWRLRDKRNSSRSIVDGDRLRTREKRSFWVASRRTTPSNGRCDGGK